MLELKNLGKKLSKYFGKKLSEINQKFGCAQKS